MKHILATTIAMLAFYAPALAGPLEDGVAAYDRGDNATAVSLFLPLAEQGNADAQYQLGKMYASGHGVPQDHVEAIAWFRLAAEQGHADAQRNLGILYQHGRGVPKDYTEAVAWFRLAAERGDPAAQNSLGIMYKDGLGIPQDDVLAHMWFNLAAAQEFDGAARDRRSVARRMTPEQIAEAQSLAREWRPTPE